MHFIFEQITLIFSSAVTIIVIYLKVPINNIQQIVVLIMAILLIASNRIFSNNRRQFLSQLIRLGLLSLSTLFVQLLVLSTGGLASPFLILFHLYTLGISLLFNILLGIGFVIFSLIAILTQIQLDQKIKQLFLTDPGSMLLYASSLVVIVPLSLLLTRFYQLKDTLVNILNKEVKMFASRQESLFLGVSELVILTDTNLIILSISEAVERQLRLTGPEIIHHKLLEMINLKDVNNQPVTPQSLSIDRVLNEKSARITKGLYLYPKSNKAMIEVVVQIRPIANLEGEISQLMFVITDAKVFLDEAQHTNLEQARIRRNQAIQQLQTQLFQKQLPELNKTLKLISKTDEDLLTALELEEHRIVEKVRLTDLALITGQVINQVEGWANSLGVKINFILPEAEASEKAKLKINQSQLNPSTMVGSTGRFVASVDPKWFRIALTKLIEVMVYLSSTQPKTAQTDVKINLFAADEIEISIGSIYPAYPTDLQKQDLLREYYGSLISITNLKSASGLEGFIAKTICQQLNIPLKVQSRIGFPGIEYRLVVKRLPN